MPYKDPIKQKEYFKEYQHKNREKINKKNKEWKINNKERVLEIQRNWYLLNKKRSSEIHKISNLKLRIAVLNAYSNNDPKCACCGEKEIAFLAIDHINGGGNKHVKSIKGKFYNWLKKNNYPKGFQVLCHNCNMAKGFYGKCPHIQK